MLLVGAQWNGDEWIILTGEAPIGFFFIGYTLL